MDAARYVGAGNLYPVASGGRDANVVRHHALVEGEESLRLRGFAVGADDFVIKPFSMRELIARVRALLRRSRVAVANRLLIRGDLQLDHETRRAWIPERSATCLREADLNVLSKLGNQGLEWRLEPEAFTGREVCREDDLLDVLVGCPVDIQVARQPST